MRFLAGFALGIVVGVAAVIVMALCVGAGRINRLEDERVDDWSEYAAMVKRQRQAREDRG